MKKIIKPYSFIVLYAAILISFVALIQFFLYSSFYWLIIGISDIITFLMLINNNQKKNVNNFKSNFSKIMINLFLILNIFIIFFSTAYGLFLIISYFNIHNSFLIYLPYISFLLIILGNIISLYQSAFLSINFNNKQ